VGSEIDDEGYPHILRVLQDRDSGVVRLASANVKGEQTDVTIWTAFSKFYFRNLGSIAGVLVLTALQLRITLAFLIGSVTQGAIQLSLGTYGSFRFRSTLTPTRGRITSYDSGIQEVCSLAPWTMV